MQNDVAMNINTSEWKPEVVISRPWIEITHRNFFMQIDFELLKQVPPSRNPNAELDLRLLKLDMML